MNRESNLDSAVDVRLKIDVGGILRLLPLSNADELTGLLPGNSGMNLLGLELAAKRAEGEIGFEGGASTLVELVGNESICKLLLLKNGGNTEAVDGGG